MVIGIIVGFLSLFLTILGSSIGVAAWVTRHLTEIKTDVKHAFRRLDDLESLHRRLDEDLEATRRNPAFRSGGHRGRR